LEDPPRRGRPPRGPGLPRGDGRGLDPDETLVPVSSLETLSSLRETEENPLPAPTCMKTRILVTGASGFVGRAFCVRHQGRDDLEIRGLGRRPSDLPGYIQADLALPL